MREHRKAKTIALWTASVLLAALFAWSGINKLRSAPMAIESFHKYGYSLAFMKLIGTCELAGAIGLLVPRLRSLAALGLMVIMGGAIFNHVKFHEWTVIALPIGVLAVLVCIEVASWLPHAPSAPRRTLQPQA
jgi:putative oxidoreductase